MYFFLTTFWGQNITLQPSSLHLWTISSGIFSKAINHASKETRKNFITPPLYISRDLLIQKFKIHKIEDQYSIYKI